MGSFFNDINTAIEIHRSFRRKNAVWVLLICVFFLISQGAFKIVRNAEKNADFMAGKETAEKLLHANIISFAIIILAFIALVLIFIKTWRGTSSSIIQLIAFIGIPILLFFDVFCFGRAIYNISYDIKNPEKLQLNQYILCRKDSDYYVAFDDKDEHVLLLVPESKYDELKSGTAVEPQAGDEIYDLIVNSQYTQYKDTQVYDLDIEVTYYPYSVIYESCNFKH